MPKTLSAKNEPAPTKSSCSTKNDKYVDSEVWHRIMMMRIADGWIAPRGYFAVIPRTHVLADAKTIRLNQLRDEPFCFLKDDKGNFEEAYQFCIECGFIPNAILVTNHSYYKNRFLSEGRCCGIIPTGWRIPYSLSQKLVVIPLEGFEHYTDIQLYWSDDALHSVTASRFLEHVKEKLQRQD